jgi:hypothetical protein
MRRVLGRRLGRMDVRFAPVNGRTGFLLLTGEGGVASVGSIDVRDGRIAAIHWVINPDKLTWIDAP